MKVTNLVQQTDPKLTQTEIESAIQQQLLNTIDVLRDKNFMVGFAESCTGGLLSSLMTAQPGVSDVFWGSVVSYSNEAKVEFLNVNSDILKTHGAVSAACAKEMSEGLLQKMKTEKVRLGSGALATKGYRTVSITGIAGPKGESADKPVGTVFISCSGSGIATQVFQHEFANVNRQQIQYSAALAALKHLLDNV